AHEIPNMSLALAAIRALLEQDEQITLKLSDTEEAGAAQGSGRGQAQSAVGAGGSLSEIMVEPIGTGTSDRLSVVVYERGFVYLNKVKKKIDIIRWDQIAQVNRRTYRNATRVEYSIKVTCDDGSSFVFPHSQPRIAGIGLYVEQKAAEWALPALL